MTTAPQVAALAFDDIDDAVNALRARGLRLSIARRMVLELLFKEIDPVSAEHVAQTLGIDVASVYRNLEMLERHGLVHHVHLGHGPGLYVLVGRGEHEYLYCDRCATVTPVEPEQLDPIRDQLRESFGYEVRFTHFPLVGLCRGCAGDDPPPAHAAARAPSPRPLIPAFRDRSPARSGEPWRTAGGSAPSLGSSSRRASSSVG